MNSNGRSSSERLSICEMGFSSQVLSVCKHVVNLLMVQVIYLVIDRISILVVRENKLFSLKHQEVRAKFESGHLRPTFTITYSDQPVVIASLKVKRNFLILCTINEMGDTTILNETKD